MRDSSLHTARDVAAEKVAVLNEMLEARLQEQTQIVASIGDGLVILDAGERVVLLNPVAASMLGWSSAEATGKPATVVFPFLNEQGKSVPRTARACFQALRTGRIVKHELSAGFYGRRRDGSTFPVETTAAPVIVRGRTVGVVSVLRDVTREHAVDRAKSEFISLASHQLRTPLTAIKWYAELLLEDRPALSRQQGLFLGEVYHATKRMIDTVEALLNLSRIEMGVLPVRPQTTDVRPIMTSVLRELTSEIIREDLEVEEAFTKDLPTLTTDPKLLRAVFQNLLSNAVRYTPRKGKITVQILPERRTENASRRGNTPAGVRVVVSDTGPWIPQRDRERVFQKLFRAENVRKRNAEGMGLGLYIAKAIVTHLGGEISFTSEEGKGTAFVVTLPARPPGEGTSG